MSLSFSTGVHAAFFAPLDGLAAVSAHARQCPEFSDADWLAAGLGRCLEKAGSGRGFLQEHGLRLAAAPTHSNPDTVAGRNEPRHAKNKSDNPARVRYVPLASAGWGIAPGKPGEESPNTSGRDAA